MLEAPRQGERVAAGLLVALGEELFCMLELVTLLVVGW